MNLLPPEAIAALPPLYASEQLPSAFDAVAQVKWFGSGRWTFYALEARAEYPDGREVELLAEAEGIAGRDFDVLFHGYIISALGADCDEFCYMRLGELAALQFPPFGLPAERDLHWDPLPLRAELADRWGVTV